MSVISVKKKRWKGSKRPLFSLFFWKKMEQLRNTMAWSFVFTIAVFSRLLVILIKSGLSGVRPPIDWKSLKKPERVGKHSYSVDFHHKTWKGSENNIAIRMFFVKNSRTSSEKHRFWYCCFKISMSSSLFVSLKHRGLSRSRPPIGFFWHMKELVGIITE